MILAPVACMRKIKVPDGEGCLGLAPQSPTLPVGGDTDWSTLTHFFFRVGDIKNPKSSRMGFHSL